MTNENLILNSSPSSSSSSSYYYYEHIYIYIYTKICVLLKVIKLLSSIKIAFPISYKNKIHMRKCGWSRNFHTFGVHYYMIQYMGLPSVSSSFKIFFLFLIILLINKSCWIYIKLCTRQLLLPTIAVRFHISDDEYFKIFYGNVSKFHPKPLDTWRAPFDR